MKATKSQRTYLIRKGKQIKEYTLDRIARKLQSGDLSPNHLAHNRDGLWRPLEETPGFRKLCKAIGALGHAEFQVNPRGACQEPVPEKIPKDDSARDSAPRESVETVTHSILQEEGISFPEGVLDAGEDSHREKAVESRAHVAVPCQSSASPVEKKEIAFGRQATNPYANRQNFRTRKAEEMEVDSKVMPGLGEMLRSAKVRILAASIVVGPALVFIGQYLFATNTPQKPADTRQQLSLLVNPDQEKSLLVQGHGRGVPEKDKKFMDAFRKSFMENMKGQRSESGFSK